MKRIHKASGWTRETVNGHWRIVPTDGSGERLVYPLSAGSWQNLPNDNRANVDTDRVILVKGEPLPDWAMEWLTKANARQHEDARARFQSAIDDADWHAADGW